MRRWLDWLATVIVGIVAIYILINAIVALIEPYMPLVIIGGLVTFGFLYWRKTSGYW